MPPRRGAFQCTIGASPLKLTTKKTGFYVPLNQIKLTQMCNKEWQPLNALGMHHHIKKNDRPARGAWEN